MSDTAHGPGWWLAADGRWYPAGEHPHWQGEVPPPQPDYRPPGAPAEGEYPLGELPPFAEVVPAPQPAPGGGTGLETLEVRTDGGRTVEVLVAGPEGGTPLLFHHGTPFAAAPWPAAAEAAARRGLRMVTWSRPGYAGSTRRPGRSVADTAADATAVLDSLGQGRFVTVGWSGGGPHALACAALLGDRCAAVATVGSLAPYDAEGLDWLAGMAASRVAELALAVDGGPAFLRFLDGTAAALGAAAGPDVAAAFGGPLSPVDAAALADEPEQALATALRSALAGGVAGWHDDDTALVRDWGFELAGVRIPVAVWQGGEDRLAPPTHGAWLAKHLPAGHRRPLPTDGHVSPVLQLLDPILADLLDLAGGARTPP